MSDLKTISATVDKAIKTANYNKNNNILHPEDETRLKEMVNEMNNKIQALEKEKGKLDMCLMSGEHEIFS